ncbi:MAG: Glutamate-1-semialdehyde 2,1-aminomutase [Candidatus Methanofastidiosum methylothiophilum]|jgi:acetylornithine/LysW-gamma-L-lysine aminotransferase|uniref:Putative [LysW]-aminoadipate semialdehyde/glutamate semialdehyde transaminase n=1 Tax=Candidatus Methanofastidiosum methylothiophilum TaxID=1705564 RepID=A0A150JIG7_9EURY|nr:MAG: Glutamate-1-semialdehyde 2,1-aminomutase [Candidatus Methanofastidiosum methylthiophilus]MBP6932290.1 aspartate aminotransferase family protein [Methanofastidiosum sp.]OQC51552.1 MAG: Glutamate-1-semialdehyde 2,1-aminomutase [Euryarchaeota archaeon ADurb.Bin023]KYC57020.1 MAG: Glutamate-1-semialdehyde 2,1-aminomutase [Candidatus Methanofastidiosum methylthiophilus]KYC57956.1 MAG: Glutamate-1-semialdehyde 2,1-aminomutase [Candidatus Methanofastidiosum methylthiophilus]
MIYKDLEEKYGSGVYYKRDIEIVRGKGVYLYDSQNNEYIDCVGGHGVCLFGHSHPNIIKAIKDQSDKLISCPEIFYNDKRAELLEKLAEITPKGLTKTFLSNSGTEAVEAALKFSRKITGKTDIISFTFGFHGRTMGALSATWKAEYKKPFLPLVPGFCHTAYNNLEKLQEVITDNTAAIIVEPVQGEGGVKAANMDFIKGIREICDQKGILMIVDEVQTGFGRTGELFAINRYNVSPDIMCLGKGIAGGIPMGATVVREDLANLEKGEHGSTFGGNPLACSASLAAIKTLKEEKLVEKSKENGEYFLSQLRKNIDESVYKDVRGLGLIIGIEMKQKVGPYLVKLMEKKILALTAGKLVVRYLPPLIIEKEHIDRVVEATGEVLGRN